MTWLTSKVQAGDVQVLKKLGAGPLLRDCIEVVYRKRRGENAGFVSATLPTGDSPLEWEARPLAGRGMELGGPSVLTPSGRSVYKGLNVFPGRLRGEPIGKWDGSTPPRTPRAYQYEPLFDHDRLFVARELAQLPTIAPVPRGAIFTNTVNIFQLRQRFALNGWVLSRPIMFVAATCLRATIVEDLVCHWYQKSLGLLPMPRDPNETITTELEVSTEELIHADDNLSDRWRHVEDLIRGAPAQSVNQLVASGSSLVAEVVLPLHDPDDTLPDEIRITDVGLEGDSGAFQLVVPNADVRVVLWYMIDRKRLQDEADVPTSYIGNCLIPTDLDPVASAIREAKESSAADEFERARARIDVIASRALGLADEELAYITERFETDPFLSQIRPMWAHRGLHAQGYQDHSGGDRFEN